MSDVTLSAEPPIVHPPAPPRRLTPLSVGQTWHAKLPGDHDLTCVFVDEVTRRTVALSQVSDLTKEIVLGARRYKRSDVEFVERVPE